MNKSQRPVVYVIGPYSLGDTAKNVHTALETATLLRKEGFAPLVPHLLHFWSIHAPVSENIWIEIGENYLRVSDAAFRIPGESVGGDHEEDLCRYWNIPLFTDIRDIIAWKKNLC